MQFTQLFPARLWTHNFPLSKRARLFSIWRLGMSSVWSTGKLVSWGDKFCLQTVSAKDESSKYCSAIWQVLGRHVHYGCSLQSWRTLPVVCLWSTPGPSRGEGGSFHVSESFINGSKVREMWKRNHIGKSMTKGHPEQRADQSIDLSQTLCLLCIKRHGCILFSHTVSNVNFKDF